MSPLLTQVIVVWPCGAAIKYLVMNVCGRARVPYRYLPGASRSRSRRPFIFLQLAASLHLNPPNHRVLQRRKQLFECASCSVTGCHYPQSSAQCELLDVRLLKCRGVPLSPCFLPQEPPDSHISPSRMMMTTVTFNGSSRVPFRASAGTVWSHS